MDKNIVKPLIAPFQQILLSKGKCVACMRELQYQKKEPIDENNEKVSCECRRVYIHQIQQNTYRRAKEEEV